MVLNYSAGDEVIASFPSSPPTASSSASATSTSTSSSSGLASSEETTTAVRTPTLFSSCPLSSPSHSVSPSDTPASHSSPTLPSPSTSSSPPSSSSPSSPCELSSHSSPSPSTSPPTISSLSIPSIQEESASLLVSYYNASTCFPSSSSGITDDESTISTDSGTGNAERSTNCDAIQNGENNDNNDDLSHHKIDEFSECNSGISHNNHYTISTIPLQNTIYNNYCTKYDIVSDISYDRLKLNATSNTKTNNSNNNQNNNYITRNISNKNYNKQKYKNHNKNQNKQKNVVCYTNDNTTIIDKESNNGAENYHQNEDDNENGGMCETECEAERRQESDGWRLKTPEKCQDVYTSLTHSHTPPDSCHTNNNSSSSSSSRSSSCTGVDVGIAMVEDKEEVEKEVGEEDEKLEDIDINETNLLQVLPSVNSITPSSSVPSNTADNENEVNIDNDSNKSTQTERVYVLKNKQKNQNSNINSNSTIIMKSKCNEEYPFTTEQALLVAEVLYVLRPVVYAWAVHYIQQRKRKRRGHGDGQNVDEINSIINNVGAGVRPSDNANVNSMKNDEVLVSDKKRGGTGSDDVDDENSFFSTVEDFLPLLLSLVSTYVRVCV